MSNSNTHAKIVEGVPAQVSVFADMLQVKMQVEGVGSRGVRRKCKGFSKASRRRLIYKMAQWSMSGLHVYFVTLTYPGVYADDWEIWKRDCDTFRKMLERSFPDLVGACWRFEFQKRGAPHFHLVLAFCKHQNRVHLIQIVSRKWADIVRGGYKLSGGDMEAYKPHYRNHVKAGTKVQHIVHGRKQLMAYVGKYIGKVEENNMPEEWGRSWGFWNVNGELDFDPVEVLSLDHSETAVLRRLVRKWLRSNGKRWLAETMATSASFSALGLGAESANHDLCYKMLGGVAKGLFEAHNSPVDSTRFIDRVQTGAYGAGRVVSLGMRVSTPMGFGKVTGVRFCEILGRFRCSVVLDAVVNSVRWHAFDMGQVHSFTQGALF